MFQLNILKWMQESATENTESLIEQLLHIGAALSDTYDLGDILHLILSKSREITCSDAGSVYLVEKKGNQPTRLLFKVAQNDSLPDFSFHELAINMTPKSLAGYVALTGESLNLSDAYNLPLSVPYKFDKSFDKNTGYRTCSVLVLPMQNRSQEIIGVLQLINRKINSNAVLTAKNFQELIQPYSQWEERIVSSLASQAAISIERNHLQENIENLFDGLVKASVQAIEARDLCTSGHSERVAKLTVSLCQEVNTITSGPLWAVSFNEQQIKEVRYAALLHDFGKIGVPEAILTKRKKLYEQQLELIQQRFSVAQRTLEMEHTQTKYKQLLGHLSDISQQHTQENCPLCQKIENLDLELETAITKLNNYWQIVLTANEPTITTEEPLKQLKQLLLYTYKDIDGQVKSLITPEEMAQLAVPRGNLTFEERKAIESHVTHSYEFLKRIPWTNNLQQIPEIAYGHHEKLDGSGYPRGLKQKDISIQAQIMVIADIYDALTAGDRPYKQGLPVEVALRIMRHEAAQNKINSNFLELFEQREVFSILGHSK
ncbi:MULTISPECIES: HD domain-containing phosphohydrolase [unclassified Okeania]|uniref:HD domain-containing phosphohydrolase n=1 Tax=unclassified Okeania TaxID=2634635 RepID=UPI0013BAC640|nr:MULTISPECIES: HD domain-containing phosphohydrolase [unclassified Okeania]NES79457.1 HD domain-containing protein [Okeania sp. SIO1H4]NET12472.1 HD domain-containing protein [Okeania sp. SIO1H6]NET23710.1 HD domain-containing protein [Okeania sp. SIO1H5]NET96749.1 HD domain-containing protein [Okeania sp. SIO1H2]